jgi:hypothetical protein
LDDLTLSPLALTVIGGLLASLSTVIGVLYRQQIKDRDREIARLEADLRAKVAELQKKDAELEWWQRLTLRATEVADWAAHGYASGSPPPLGPGERGHGGR